MMPHKGCAENASDYRSKGKQRMHVPEKKGSSESRSEESEGRYEKRPQDRNLRARFLSMLEATCL
eukprot:378571-Pelagomonas_calceolata.AAC.3